MTQSRSIPKAPKSCDCGGNMLEFEESFLEDEVSIICHICRQSVTAATREEAIKLWDSKQTADDPE